MTFITHKFNPLLRFGLELEDNVSTIDTIITQLAAQTGLAYTKEGEFAVDFDYTLIAPADLEETDLYLIATNGIKDVNFPATTYSMGDLIYWKNAQWNTIANGLTDFSTENITGIPLHRGINLLRAISDNELGITAASYNLPGFITNANLIIDPSNVNSTITLTGTSSYSFVENAKTVIIVIDNQKSTAITMAFSGTIWGSTVSVLPVSSDLIVPAGEKGVFMLVKSAAIITIEKFGVKRMKIFPFSFTSADQTVGTYNVPIAHNLDTNLVSAVLYDKDGYLYPQMPYKRVDKDNGQFENSTDFDGTLTGFIIAYYSKIFPFSFTSADQTVGTYNVLITHLLNSNNVNAVLYDKDGYLYPQMPYKKLGLNSGQFENSTDFDGTLTGFISLLDNN